MVFEPEDITPLGDESKWVFIVGPFLAHLFHMRGRDFIRILVLFSCSLWQLNWSSAESDQMRPKLSPDAVFALNFEMTTGYRIEIEEFEFEGEEFSKLVIRRGNPIFPQALPKAFDPFQAYWFQNFILAHINKFAASNHSRHGGRNAGGSKEMLRDRIHDDPYQMSRNTIPKEIKERWDFENNTWLNQIQQEESLAVLITKKNDISHIVGAMVVLRSDIYRLAGHWMATDPDKREDDDYRLSLVERVQGLVPENARIFEMERMSVIRGNLDPVPMMLAEVYKQNTFWTQSGIQGGITNYFDSSSPLTYENDGEPYIGINSLPGTVPMHLAMGFEILDKHNGVHLMGMPAERYESDINRYINGEAVNHHPPNAQQLRAQNIFMNARKRRKVLVAQNIRKVNVFKNWNSLSPVQRDQFDLIAGEERRWLSLPPFITYPNPLPYIPPSIGFKCEHYFNPTFQYPFY